MGANLKAFHPQYFLSIYNMKNRAGMSILFPRVTLKYFQPLWFNLLGVVDVSLRISNGKGNERHIVLTLVYYFLMNSQKININNSDCWNITFNREFFIRIKFKYFTPFDRQSNISNLVVRLLISSQPQHHARPIRFDS